MIASAKTISSVWRPNEQVPVPESRQPDLLWLRPDRVTHVDVAMQGGARQFTAESVRRPPFLWSLESRHDLQGVANHALCTAQGLGNLDQRRRPGTLPDGLAGRGIGKQGSFSSVPHPCIRK